MENYSGGGGGERSSSSSLVPRVSMPSGIGMLLVGHGSREKQPWRPSVSEMNNVDVDVDADLQDDKRGGGGGGGGPMKLARTDAFTYPELKMHMGTGSATDHHNHLVRNSGGSSCLLSDGRLGVLPTNSNGWDGMILSHDGGGEGRVVVSAAGARSGLPLQVYHCKAAGMPSSMGMGMGMVTAVRPPFSPSQWQELEQQALIYKYMMAGVPVPSDLLLPIRKSLLSFPGGSHLLHHHSTLTPWTSFQMGYGGNVDPEPGRCRRTDGKKWRCSRDVVPDQKYCERHMHRGRHRGSRKPVEGHNATAAALNSQNTSSSSTNASSTYGGLNLAAVGTRTSNLRPSVSVLGAKNMSFGGNGSQFQQYLLHGGVTAGEAATSNKDYRIKAEQINEQSLFCEAGSSTVNNQWCSMVEASKAVGFSQSKSNSNGSGSMLNFNSSTPQQRSLVGQDFGLMSQAANFHSIPAQQHSFLGGSNNRSMEDQTDREERAGQPLRHFFDDWPRSRDDPWTHNVGEERSKRCSSTTQTATDSTSSPRGKLSLSPLKLSMSRDGNEDEDDPLGVDPIEMGLGVGMNMNLNVEDNHGQHHPQANWIPIAWENPIGMLGPLAEALQSSTPRGNNKKPGLNLMNDNDKENGWKKNKDKSWSSPSRESCIASSPTGVLQKTFASLSDTNSAATSSSQIASS